MQIFKLSFNETVPMYWRRHLIWLVWFACCVLGGWPGAVAATVVATGLGLALRTLPPPVTIYVGIYFTAVFAWELTASYLWILAVWLPVYTFYPRLRHTAARKFVFAPAAETRTFRKPTKTRISYERTKTKYNRTRCI